MTCILVLYTSVSVRVLCSLVRVYSLCWCECIITLNFDQLMRDPTSLFSRIAFPRWGLVLPLEQGGVPPTMSVDSVRISLVLVGAYLFCLQCRHYYRPSHRLRVTLLPTVPYAQSLPQMPQHTQPTFRTTTTYCACHDLSWSTPVLPQATVCAVSSVCGDIVSTFLGESFRFPCTAGSFSLWITTCFLWITSYITYWIALSFPFPSFFPCSPLLPIPHSFFPSFFPCSSLPLSPFFFFSCSAKAEELIAL